MKTITLLLISFVTFLVSASPMAVPVEEVDEPIVHWSGRPVPAWVIEKYGLTGNNPTNATDESNIPIPTVANRLRKRDTICQTSGGSPVIADIQFLINYLFNLGDRVCNQIQNRAPYCTEMVEAGEAAIGICGYYNFHMSCRSAALIAQRIKDQCKLHINSQWRAGGIGQTWGTPGAAAPDMTGILIYHS